ncbi:MAG: c-type cytochrome [Colwellia sp.]|jgi:cytochrome c553|uniref:c-type cytochrome n=1 Tax=Colwellia sp. Bg11-12 TaxID=2759817 RepID=UPI0015F549FD|nr:c-type cytochrome [Colwellia sp. Bg11-12]MBA6263458.1 cytochrome c4 [Colwellia sp. Bg11-12]
MNKIIFSLILAVTSINVAFAAAGNADAGKSKAAMCAACHGADGISVVETYPNLAGQQADYIATQLQAFKSGTRVNATMASMSAGLSEQDMADLAAYFSSLDRSGATASIDGAETDAVAGVAEVAPVAYVANAIAGKSLYELGDPSRNIASCIGCHGKEGNSKVLINPNLANQHAQYIETQLHAFKDKTRINYAMNQFAGAMTDEDIADMGAYFSDTKAVAHVVAKRVATVAVITEEAIAGKAKSAVCSACHGVGGNSVVPMYPKLAGQHAEYTAKQLKEFKSGARENAVMAGMAAALSEQDMAELGAYFASQKPTPGNGKESAFGRKLYFGGDVARGITACIACHGVSGKGIAKAGFPAVANQSVEYLTAQLTSFKAGERYNDRNSMMRNIAKRLKQKDIDALAQFMSSLK